MHYLNKIQAGLLTGIIMAAGAASASVPQPIDKNGKLCAEQTAKAERRANIPRHLLTAVSLAESGVWDAAGKANVAWPWTVTSGTDNWYFATKDDAVTQVLELWEKGVKNIDVGCMQINLHYHSEAFKDLEQAFDPYSNVAYASNFLQTLYSSTRSWTEAVANYHSATPERNRPYKMKVIKLWNEARRNAGGGNDASPPVRPPVQSAAAERENPPPPRSPVQIDMARTDQLNARLRLARAVARGEDPQNVRQSQLASWRAGAEDPQDIYKMASMRRAALESKRLKEVRGVAKEDGGEAFAAKRREQLQFRRENVGTPNS
ncbi:MAG: hypothetical protein A3G18_12235 [Rhodospirillales bacterium RIFCSPLOWO2_12_FULL_58_28]|nr:MAG: hypothetical protein A3G18_12235 [Rhodospirillales bacterium RIFCSPLOWO2_12_FULL_58_28]